MTNPKISVVIPSYNQADFVGEAIESVLDQSLPEFELVVVDDASTDNSVDIIKRFNDPRIKLIQHSKNRGLPATRNTGIKASAAELVSLLDADDYFHRDKLALHNKFLVEHPAIGVTYNNRFELNYSANSIRQIVRTPQTVTLSDLVERFPFTPSDMVIRKECILDAGYFNEKFVNGGEDLDFNCQLALIGCQFGRIDRALNYRRHHSGRKRKNLPGRLDDVRQSLNSTFNDPRCPADLQSQRRTAEKHHLMVLTMLAFFQGEIELGHEYFQELIDIDPTLVRGVPCHLTRFCLENALADDSQDHEMMIKEVLTRLPNELDNLADQIDWAIQQGYLRKGLRAVFWDRMEDGRKLLAKANELSAKIEEEYRSTLVYQLLTYSIEFGDNAAEDVLVRLSPFIAKLGSNKLVNQIRGEFYAAIAYYHHREGDSLQVPGTIIKAIVNNTRYAFNRGILAIFFNSILKNLTIER